LAVIAALYVAAVPGSARAEPDGAYFEAGALPRAGYELRTRLSYSVASRTDFESPVFLFAQAPRTIDAFEVRGDLDLRIGLAESLALQVVVPLVYRNVETTFDAVVLSPAQVLEPASLRLDGFGLGDSTLALSLRFAQSELVSAFVDLGTLVPLDDNPGSTTLPKRIPAGAGQSALFMGLGANLSLGKVDATLSYRITYSPGDNATYLIRRVGNQAFTSGALGPFVAHHVVGQLSYTATPLLQLQLRPDWSYAEQPELVQRHGTQAVPGPSGRHEVGIEVALRFTLNAHHRITLGNRYTLLQSQSDDPFYPLVIPARGPNLTWQVMGD
jgi:hypothetical protein